MNREIKFRAWDTIENKMRQEALEIKDIGLGEGSVVATEEVQNDNPLKWMQFTGLFDKNGKEIYEGDIVKCRDDDADSKEFITEVVWYNAGFHPLQSYSQFFVIGNIYENPELIN